MKSVHAQLLVTLLAALAGAAIFWHKGPPPSSYRAVFHGDCRQVRRALAWGASPNYSERQCPWTALNMAVLRKDLEAVDLLIAAGADVNACHPDFGTVLHFAMRFRGTPEIIGRLLEAGADVRIKDSGGRTPLQFERARDKEIVRVLREHGVTE